MDFGTDDQFQYRFIPLLAERMKPSLYLEMGVRGGQCISRVAPHAGRSIGVDLVWPGNTEGYEFFQCSTREFIDSHLPKFRGVELCFIDADHRHESVLADYEGVRPFMADSGIIILHDTFPEEEWRTGFHESGDCWRTASYIREHASEYNIEIVTLPVPPGLSIIRCRGGKYPWMS